MTTYCCEFFARTQITHDPDCIVARADGSPRVIAEITVPGGIVTTPATPRPWRFLGVGEAYHTSRACLVWDQHADGNGGHLHLAGFSEADLRRYCEVLNAADDPEAENAYDELREENTTLRSEVQRLGGLDINADKLAEGEALMDTLRAEHAEAMTLVSGLYAMLLMWNCPFGKPLRHADGGDVDCECNYHDKTRAARALLAKMDGAK